MVKTREARKAAEENKPRIKDVTQQKLADKTGHRKAALKIKTNRKVFTPSKARDHFVLTPEGRILSVFLLRWL